MLSAIRVGLLFSLVYQCELRNSSFVHYTIKLHDDYFDVQSVPVRALQAGSRVCDLNVSLFDHFLIFGHKRVLFSYTFPLRLGPQPFLPGTRVLFCGEW